MDGRYEAAYPSYLIDENFQFCMEHCEWPDILDAYSTDAVLIPRRLPLAEEMPRLRGWDAVYRDDYFSVYARTGAELPRVDNTGRVFHGTFP